MVKKKIFYHSDWSLGKTGFGRAAKALLSYLYKTGKYEIIHYSCSVHTEDPKLAITPWKSIGCLPSDQVEIDKLKQAGTFSQAAYGEHLLDETIKKEKPDFYIGVQDIWGVCYAIDKPWFNKIHSVIWTTLDSLPILPLAVQKANKIKNYWIWSDFATKDLNNQGFKHVKTVHGPLDITPFYRLNDIQRQNLRKKCNIRDDVFIVGFVFRNQLRKSVPNLIEGYSLFKKQNKGVKSAILLHTSWSEGWNIYSLADEYKVDKGEILTTYICSQCKNYIIRPFVGEKQKCLYCGKDKCTNTTNTGLGVNEEQLNEVYNLMDVYLHPFTSGGTEIPIIEAKLTELITLVTEYSCGEELCQEGTASIPLEWWEYREPGTQFRKASTNPQSIADSLTKVYRMSSQEQQMMGKQAKLWAIQNYSVDVVGKYFENFLDSLKPTNFDWKISPKPRANPNAQIPFIQDDQEWLKILYKEVLYINVKPEDQGLLHWLEQLNRGMPREQIEQFFKQEAQKALGKKEKKKDIKDYIEKTDRKKLLIVLKESFGDLYLLSSLLKSFKETHSNHDIYIGLDPKYNEIFDGNKYVHGLIPYDKSMESEVLMTGRLTEKGPFDSYCNIALATQKQLSYLSLENINLNLNY